MYIHTYRANNHFILVYQNEAVLLTRIVWCSCLASPLSDHDCPLLLTAMRARASQLSSLFFSHLSYTTPSFSFFSLIAAIIYRYIYFYIRKGKRGNHAYANVTTPNCLIHGYASSLPIDFILFFIHLFIYSFVYLFVYLFIYLDSSLSTLINRIIFFPLFNFF